VHVWEIFAELFTEALVLSGIGSSTGRLQHGIGLARLVTQIFLIAPHACVIERDMLGAAVIVVMLGVISLLGLDGSFSGDISCRPAGADYEDGRCGVLDRSKRRRLPPADRF